MVIGFVIFALYDDVQTKKKKIFGELVRCAM